MLFSFQDYKCLCFVYAYTVSSLRRVPLQGLLGGDKHVRFIVVIILFYKKKK